MHGLRCARSLAALIADRARAPPRSRTLHSAPPSPLAHSANCSPSGNCPRLLLRFNSAEEVTLI
ncbi:hypothetical protein M758_10G021700 [Ceratodon purpureus]|nr:hypothetical protein M758_10G021700 [Ceratodon purpureus]